MNLQWLFIVISTVGIAAARADDALQIVRVEADDLEPLFYAPKFDLIDQNGRPFSSESLKGRPWIGGFVFTNCSGPCPLMFSQMSALQARIPDKQIKFVLFSVDPQRDTPAVRKKKLADLDGDESRWSFVSGEYDDVQRIAREMMLAGGEGNDPLLHSDRFLLFDKNGQCRARFDSNFNEEMDRLAAASMALLHERSRSHLLPLINSCFNAASVVLLICGFVFIRQGIWRAHATCMIAALCTSAAFLVGYLLNQYLHGTKSSNLPAGALKVVYLTMLFSHMVLAVVMLPMILTTLLRAATKKWDKHRAIARPTLAIWVYVSITGVLVYIALYHLIPKINGG